MNTSFLNVTVMGNMLNFFSFSGWEATGYKSDYYAGFAQHPLV